MLEYPDMTVKERPLFEVEFEDGSKYTLPKDHEGVFVDHFGHNPKGYISVAERLKFVTSKYAEHQAWPSKMDGINHACAFDYDEPYKIEGNEGNSDIKYNNPDYYWEHWRDWGDEGKAWRRDRLDIRIPNPPELADIAEAVLYQNMRGSFIEKAARETGCSLRVMSPEKFLKEMRDKDV